jgi:hypothetical protein
MPGTAFTRVSVTGVIGATTSPFEIFSYGFALKHDGDFLGVVDTDAITTAIVAFHGAAATHISTTARIREVRYAHVAANGFQDQPTRRYPMDEPGAGGGDVRPSQVALAVSLRGPAGVRPSRGRFYIPCPTQSFNPSTGMMPDPDAIGLANQAAILANAIAARGPGIRMGIDTKTGTVQVTEIRVGKVFDTIRSRRNQQNEAYVVAGTALTP